MPAAGHGRVRAVLIAVCTLVLLGAGLGLGLGEIAASAARAIGPAVDVRPAATATGVHAIDPASRPSRGRSATGHVGVAAGAGVIAGGVVLLALIAAADRHRLRAVRHRLVPRHTHQSPAAIQATAQPPAGGQPPGALEAAETSGLPVPDHA
jgi:hypothetical protein